MKKVVSSVLLGVVLVASSNSFANEGDKYWGLDFHQGSYDETGFPKANPTGFAIKAGKYITENVAMEGRLSLGLGDDTVNYLGVDVDLELDNALSFFIKGDAPLSPTANVYGLLGFTKGKLSASVGSFAVSADDSGLSYGMGVETKMNEGLLFAAEYIFYLSESTYDYTGFNFGIKRLF